MDVSTIKAAWDHYLLAGSGVASIGFSVFVTGYMLVCAYRGMCGMAKRIGWVSVAVLFSFCVWATITGTPTQEEKEDAIEQEQGEAQMNAMFGAMLVGGGLRTDVGGPGFGSGAVNSSEPEGAGDQLSDPSAFAFPDPIVEDEFLPAVRSLTIFDYASGFALSRIGTGETFDFSAPQGATVCEDWLAFGASIDWFRLGNGEWGIGNGENGFVFPFGTNEVNALTVFSNGSLRPRMKRSDTFISPFETTLCVVPSANWPLLGETSRPSQFWHYLTPSNTLVMTWQNMLLDQLVEKPVSFQVEIAEKGDIVFRYDLSRLADTTISNIVVGIRNAGYGRAFTQLDRNVTSLHWARLDPSLAADSDPDDDGVFTDDEVLVYHTDPYSADTDMDMLNDGDEIDFYHTDPNDPNSVSDYLCDGMAVTIGDVDPFSCPDGSTNTVFEHVFYTGTTNAPFSYPVETESSAVLMVTVSGVGSGRLFIGDKIVPVMARPRPLLLGASGGAGDDPTATTLRVPIEKGIRHVVWGSIPETLKVEIDSGAFTIGRLPRWYTLNRGWIAFPNTNASVPCIHDLGSRRVAVSLDPGSDISDLTCTWNGSLSIEVENRPPLAAEITGRFPRRSTTHVIYALMHPEYLFGARIYAQSARFCPRLSEDEDDEMDEYGQSDSVNAEDGYWCCFWGTCCNGQGECSCGCDCCSAGGGEDAPADMDVECPVHHVAYEQCASLHEADYDAASRLDEYPGVLKIRDPLIYERIDLPCPEGECHCCPCPDHHTNHVSLAYRSYRLRVVDDSGAVFSVSDHPCSVDVAGVRPSLAVGDAHLAFTTNGAIFRVYNETVLGMEIVKTTGPGLDTYNSLSRTLGFPMTVNTNLDHAAQLTLKTNVRLPFGNVRLSLDDTEGQFAVWRYDYRSGEYLKLLDSEGRSVINLPIDRWRRLVGSASDSSSPGTPIYITSSNKGSTTLRFGYWGVSDGQIIEDWDSQIITSVNPPLLADMNRDGRIDTNDVVACIHGREFIYWTNEDTVKGGYVGQIADGSPNANDGFVNGFLDLVNLFPLAVDLKDFVDVWGSAVSYSVEAGWGETNAFGVCFADIPWCEAGAIQTNDWITMNGEPLHSAALAEVSESGVPLSVNLIRRFSDASGVMLSEARSLYGLIRIVIRYRDAEIFGYTVPISIRRVKHLYNWINVRQFSGETENRASWCGAQPSGSGKTLVFLHGANVAESDAETWGDTIFKRLWLTGCNIDFYNVDWRSDIGLSANYHQNASNAFEVAERLAPIVATIPGEKTIMAHSLGNMVVSSMIQDHGLQVSKYLMCDSAVPSEAYCGPDDESIRVPQLLHPDWEAYSTNTWASNWHKHFRDIPGDDRKFLGWPARFPDVPAVAVNFYSTGDEVLELFENNHIGFWMGLGLDGFSTAGIIRRCGKGELCLAANIWVRHGGPDGNSMLTAIQCLAFLCRLHIITIRPNRRPILPPRRSEAFLCSILIRRVSPIQLQCRFSSARRI